MPPSSASKQPSKRASNPESGLRGRAEAAEAELAKLKADYAALSGLADQVESRLDKAIEKLKAGSA